MHRRISVPLAILITIVSVLADADPGKLTIEFDVPPEKVPGWLCVITENRSCPDSAEDTHGRLIHESLCETRELSNLNLDAISSRRASWFLPLTIRSGSYAIAGFSKKATKIRPVALEFVVKLLRERESKYEQDCDKPHGMCRPTLQPPLPLSEDRITCGGTGATSNVAFIRLEYRTGELRAPGVKAIQLIGTQASLTFNGELDHDAHTFVEVIGGDYAPSLRSAPGSNEHALVQLHPRCSRTIAEIPGYKAMIRRVSISSDSTDPQHSGWCDARQQERTLAIDVPYTPESERKSLRVTYATTPETSAEATWTTALPPVPFKLGVRSFEFRWRRPTGCASENWRDPSHVPSASDAEWNVSCPRVTLPEGSTCKLTSGIEEPACSYWCSIDYTIGSMAPPIAVHFDRMRKHEAAGPKNVTDIVVYSWDDQVRFSGQELVSVVAPENRRVMLEYEDPSAWQDNFGVKIDEIRLFTTVGGADRLRLTGRSTGKSPPRWTALSTPGTCLHEAFVGLAIFGTHPYNERSVEVIGGVVKLHDPAEYRSRLHYHALLGSGTQSEFWGAIARPYAETGIRFSYDLASPFTLSLDVSGQLSRKSYDTIPLFTKSRTRETVSYRRFDLRAGIEFWWTGGTHVFGAIGAGLGSALNSSDDERVGDQCGWLSESCSLTTEVGAMINIIQRRIWLVPLAGLRFGERYVSFGTDFFGQPTPGFTYTIVPYFGVRLQWRIN